jgi:hypothetical protein
MAPGAFLTNKDKGLYTDNQRVLRDFDLRGQKGQEGTKGSELNN